MRKYNEETNKFEKIMLNATGDAPVLFIAGGNIPKMRGFRHFGGDEIKFDKRISFDSKMNGYTVSVYKGDEYIGAIKGWVSTKVQAEEEANNIIRGYLRMKNIKSKNNNTMKRNDNQFDSIIGDMSNAEGLIGGSAPITNPTIRRPRVVTSIRPTLLPPTTNLPPSGNVGSGGGGGSTTPPVTTPPVTTPPPSGGATGGGGGGGGGGGEKKSGEGEGEGKAGGEAPKQEQKKRNWLIYIVGAGVGGGLGYYIANKNKKNIWLGVALGVGLVDGGIFLYENKSKAVVEIKKTEQTPKK